jgi:probable HAF family extracellular repeat protein
VTTKDDVGEHEFVVFVNTSLLPAFPIELDKNTVRKVVVKSVTDPSLAPGPYTVTRIGTFGGGLVKLDSTGQAAAGTQFAPASPRYGQIWRNNTLETIGAYPGSTVTSAQAINSSGKVVGLASGNNLPTALGFLWQDGQWTDLSKFTPSQAGQKISAANTPRVINDAGVIAGEAGWYLEACSGYWGYATVWHDGVVRKLGLISQPPTPCNVDASSQAHNINQLGHVVGVSYSARSDYEAFIWREGEMQGLGFLEGGKFSEAFGVSDNGLVVGKSTTAAYPSSRFHATLWKQGQAMDLHPNNAISSEARAVNSSGQVLINASGGGVFVWQEGKFYPIQDLVPPNSFYASDLFFLDINNKGQILGLLQNQGVLLLLTPSN